MPFPDAFIAALGETAGTECLRIAVKLRDRGLWVELGDAGSSLKSQLRRADRLAARCVLIMGDEELRSGTIKWKNLADASQGVLPLDGIEAFLSGSR
jgi:histidyl-tRNA synthetase